jgi:hypothetical protein
MHPPGVWRVLAGPADGGAHVHPVSEALERFTRARSRQRAGAHTLYALPRAGPIEGDDSVLAPLPTARGLYSEADSDAFGIPSPSAPL